MQNLRGMVGVVVTAVLLGGCGVSATVGVGELRSGQFHRQDVLEAEIQYQHVSVLLSSRHGENDDNNSALPVVGLAVVPTWAVFGAVVGAQAYPWDYGRWRAIIGPRFDILLRSHVQLHVEHVWRQEGLYQFDIRSWSPRTVYRLDWRF